jgi:hypothetical protein
MYKNMGTCWYIVRIFVITNWAVIFRTGRFLIPFFQVPFTYSDSILTDQNLNKCL